MYRIIDRRRVRKNRKTRFWHRRKVDMSRHRLCVFRSSRHIQAQVFDDNKGFVIASVASFEEELKQTGLRGKEMAKKVGNLIAERAKKQGVSQVVFDRNGFFYHGRIESLASSAREAGLQF